MGKSKILSKNTLKSALICIAGIAAGAAIMPAGILGQRGAFVPALAACMSPVCASFAVLGAVLVSLAFGAEPGFAAMLASSAVCILIRLWMGEPGRRRYPFALAASVGACSLSIRLLWAILTKEPLVSLAPAAIACVVSALSVYAIAAALRTPSLVDLKSLGPDAAGRLAMFAVCAMCAYGNGGVNASEVLSGALTCAAVFMLPGAEAAAFCGFVCAGSFLGGWQGYPAIAPILTALFCPKPARKSRAAVGVCYAAALSVLSLVSWEADSPVHILLGALGAAAFAVSPKKYIETVSPSGRSQSEHHTRTDGRGIFLSKALDRLAMNLDEALPDDKPSVGDLVYAGVCMSCENHAECFSDDPSAGIESPSHVCIRFDEMRRSAAEAERRLSSETASRAEASRRRGVMRAVLPVMSRMAVNTESGVEISSLPGQEALGEGKAYISPDGFCSAYFESGQRISEARLLRALSEQTGRRLHVARRSEESGMTRLEILPDPALSAETSGYQSPREDGEPSGDFYEVFTAQKYLYALLCDGMGTGEEAALCSRTVAGALKELFMSGFGPETAVPLAAEYLRSRIPQESFSTIDIMRLDILSGEAEFYKCGGCKSAVISAGGLSFIPGGGYPAGIMDGVEMVSASVKAGGGDVIVMLTDGAAGAAGIFDLTSDVSPEREGSAADVPMSGAGALIDIAQAASSEDAEALAARIGRTAKQSQTPETADDITVLVIKIDETQ